MNKNFSVILFAVLAAGLYAINIPISKVLLNYVDPTMMASYLYLGLGIMIIGTIIVVIDTLAKKHTHLHTHMITHTHNGSTHTHTIEHEHEHNHYLSDKKHTYRDLDYNLRQK